MRLPKIIDSRIVSDIQDKRLFLLRVFAWLPDGCVWRVLPDFGQSLHELRPFTVTPARPLWRRVLDPLLDEPIGLHVQVGPSSRSAINDMISRDIHKAIMHQFFYQGSMYDDAQYLFHSYDLLDHVWVSKKLERSVLDEWQQECGFNYEE